MGEDIVSSAKVNIYKEPVYRSEIKIGNIICNSEKSLIGLIGL